jgi:hypothetical protein
MIDTAGVFAAGPDSGHVLIALTSGELTGVLGATVE